MYELPEADGGGGFEVAGINDEYHPEMARHLKRLVEEGMFERARVDAIEYMLKYTDKVTRWTGVTGVEAFLRDCAFNRGPKGALRILQLALEVADDGKWGPITEGAMRVAEEEPERLLECLRWAREVYEKRVAPPVGARKKFWNGLAARWDEALAFGRVML